MSDCNVASLFVAMLDTPSGSATTYEPLCGVVPGVLQQVPCQVATVKVLCIRLHKQH